MPRKARFTIKNGTYHIMIRGNNQNNIFHTEEVYGSKKFIEEMKSEGLRSVWSHKGWPKKEE